MSTQFAFRCMPVSMVLGFLLLRIGLAFSAEPAVAEPVEQAASGEEAAAERHWIRVTRDRQERPVALETAVVRYTPTADSQRSGVSVDLIGAVHVGDKRYYERLNDEFEQYDALLFELVAPADVKVPKGRGASNHPVGALQNGLKGLLELEHQLEWVDYQAENFVHADMTPKQFAKSMSNRNESFLQMFFQLMEQGMAQQSKQQAQGKNGDLDLLQALFSKDRPLRLKRIMAEQFEDMESLLVGIGGPNGSTLITERNRVAMEVLTRELAAGRKKVGIFYGAGHMKDMDKRLRDEFKFDAAETRWLTAWDLQQPKHGSK